MRNQWPPGRTNGNFTNMRMALLLLITTVMAAGARVGFGATGGDGDITNNLTPRQLTGTPVAHVVASVGGSGAVYDLISETVRGNGAGATGVVDLNYFVGMNSQRGQRMTVGGPSDQPPSTELGLRRLYFAGLETAKATSGKAVHLRSTKPA